MMSEDVRVMVKINTGKQQTVGGPDPCEWSFSGQGKQPSSHNAGRQQQHNGYKDLICLYIYKLYVVNLDIVAKVIIC